jgi:hypothetical protein
MLATEVEAKKITTGYRHVTQIVGLTTFFHLGDYSTTSCIVFRKTSLFTYGTTGLRGDGIARSV